uniref:ZZ-type domain-containing protein n=1 Tax=Ditylenchus dipsaci TaxID=166011 RepID=A0A915E1S4_9BILA
MQLNKAEFQARYGRVLEVVVHLEAITDWYEMRREQTNVPILSAVNPTFCSFCIKDLTSGPSVKCLECERNEVVLCVNCFKLGAQSGEHRRGHNYKINDPVGPKVFEEDDNENGWGCYEDLSLLSSFMKSHLDQWPDISKDFGHERTINEALDRIDKFFLRGDIGDYVLKKLREIPLKLAIDEEAQSEQLSLPGHPSVHLKARNSFDNASSPNGLANVEDTNSFIHDKCGSIGKSEDVLSRQFSPPHSPISNKRLSSKQMENCASTSSSHNQSSQPSLSNENDGERKSGRRSSRASFSNRPTTARQLSRQSLITEFVEMEDSDSCSSADMPAPVRRRSSVRGSTSSRYNSGVTPPSPKCFKAAVADSENSSRRNSLDVKTSRKEMLENAKSEAAEALRGRFSSRMRKSSLELSNGMAWDEDNKKWHKCSRVMSEERMSWLREKYPNSYFYDHKPQPMTSRQISKFDDDDLQLLGYMPHRDDFEREYKNEAEQLISRISFPKGNSEDQAEVEKLLNTVRFARIQRYNRVVKNRFSKRGVILEHEMISEYLNIVKNNITEKESIAQVANKETVKTLAKSIGKMESLMDQIEELKQLKKSGVKELKGRLKVDSVPPSWCKKRKSKKADNTEQRKAGLRWKRIKRWSKKQNQASETDE